MSNSKKWLSARELADHYQITPASVAKFAKNHNIKSKPDADGKMKVWDAVTYEKEYDVYVRKVRARNNPYNLDQKVFEEQADLKSKKLKLEVRLKELEVKSIEGKYISWSDVSDWVQDIGINMRDFIETSSQPVARDISEEAGLDESGLQKVSVIVENRFEKLLQDMSVFFERFIKGNYRAEE